MLNLSTGLRNGMLNATGFKEAFANGVLYIYSGAQPASADAAPTGTLLMTVTKSAGAFTSGTSTNGLNLAAPVAAVVAKDTDNWQGTGLANGVAGYFRLCGNAIDTGGTSTTLARFDGSVATTGADMNLVNSAVTSGTPLTIDVFQYELPAN